MRRPRGLESERGAGPSVDAGRARSANSSSSRARSPANSISAIPAPARRSTCRAQKLFQVADIKLTNVGYKGQPQALIDLMTNLMHFEIVSLGLALPHIKAGNVKPLAVLTDKRVADLPDVPTIAEAGFPEAAYVPWYGIYVPAGTPDALVEKINDGINKALQNPDVQRQLVDRQHSGQADVARGSRRADEGGSREADEGGDDVGDGVAVRPAVLTPSLRGAKRRSNPCLA